MSGDQCRTPKGGLLGLPNVPLASSQCLPDPDSDSPRFGQFSARSIEYFQ
jgi:hypothetical protein